jgi:hypothetical protein
MINLFLADGLLTGGFFAKPHRPERWTEHGIAAFLDANPGPCLIRLAIKVINR